MVTQIQSMATRLSELQRVRANLQSYSHPDDLGATMALAMKYVGGTVQAHAVIAELTSALDNMIERQKADIRQSLDD